MRDNREKKGVGDRWSRYQETSAPKISELGGFKIEMLFGLFDENNKEYRDWCHGTVKKVINEKNQIVEIEWHEDFVEEGQSRRTKEKLFPAKWNPERPGKGAWREYFAK